MDWEQLNVGGQVRANISLKGIYHMTLQDYLLRNVEKVAQDAASDLFGLRQDGLIDDLIAQKNAMIESLQRDLSIAQTDLARALDANETFADLRNRVNNLERRAQDAEAEVERLRSFFEERNTPSSSG